MGGFVEGVKDLGKGVGNAVSGAVGGVVAVAKGDSPDKYWDKTGAGVNQGISGYMDVVTVGQSDKIDAYTGGAMTKLESGYSGFGNAIAGKSVSQNLKDQASLILQAGQAYAGTAGVSLGGMDLTGMTTDILGGLNNRLQGGGSSGGASPNPVNYVQPSQASYNGSVATTNYLPYILIGGIVLIGAVLLLKKK